MERRRAASQETMNRILPALQSQMDSLNAEIESILDPEQREAFRAFQSADRERFRRRGAGRGPDAGRGAAAVGGSIAAGSGSPSIWSARRHSGIFPP